MKPFTLLLAVVLFAVPTLSRAAQKVGDDFAAADVSSKKAYLLSVVKHEGSFEPKTMVANLRVALKDQDVSVRRLALSAITSRALAPILVKNPAIVADWFRDREQLRTLRSQISTTLADYDETVRVEAVSAWVSLDFDASRAVLDLNPSTEQVIVARFRQENSALVRAGIARFVSSGAGLPTPASQAMLLDAVQDEAPIVRQAALIGISRLPAEVALPVLVQGLRDQAADVRRYSTFLLSKRPEDAKPFTSDIDAAARAEADRTTREMITSLLQVLRR